MDMIKNSHSTQSHVTPFGWEEVDFTPSENDAEALYEITVDTIIETYLDMIKVPLDEFETQKISSQLDMALYRMSDQYPKRFIEFVEAFYRKNSFDIRKVYVEIYEYSIF